MGYRHSKDEILEAAAAVALEGGMASLTFAAVGKRLDISDRTVVYYFPTKPELIIAVVGMLGSQLEGLLETAFGAEPMSPRELVQRAWPVLATDATERVFSLFFEMVGLGASAHPPYDALSRVLMQRWEDWLTPRTLGSSAAAKRAGALSVMAQIDGLLLVRHLLGAEAAEAAARAAGVSATI